MLHELIAECDVNTAMFNVDRNAEHQSKAEVFGCISAGSQASVTSIAGMPLHLRAI
jgi:hypothetical protein